MATFQVLIIIIDIITVGIVATIKKFIRKYYNTLYDS